MFASHLIVRGLVEEGLTIVRAARARHDGSRRNPWNDIECGSYYARSLSSYALVNALIGLSFDQRIGEIGFARRARGDARLLLVRRPRLGRDRLQRRLGDADGQGRRAHGLAAAPADARRVASTRGRATGGARGRRRSSWARQRRSGRASASSSERTSVARLELKGVRKSFQSVEVIHGDRP